MRGMSHLVLVRFFILLGLLVNFKVEGFGIETFTVHIMNGMSQNTDPVNVHCKSGDSDLGLRTLGQGVEFDFRFKTRVVGTTLYFCSWYWDSKRASFDVFRDDREALHCVKTANCYWKAREDGFYFSVDNSNWVKRNNWN